jgi:hypothetical protein
LVTRDHADRLVAFVNQVPGVRPGVATVDLMRHRRGAANGRISADDAGRIVDQRVSWVLGELDDRIDETGLTFP